MKITLHIPIGSENQSNFIRQEIAQAQNIKSKQTRKSVVKGLNKILNILVTQPKVDGISIFTDGEELIVSSYEGVKKIYFCGKEYKEIEIKEEYPQLLVVVDSKDASIGKTNGERVNVVWSKQSNVYGKHKKGGQSQQRFSRGREQSLKHWLREVSDKLKEIYTDEEIIVGGPGMTKDKFVDELPI